MTLRRAIKEPVNDTSYYIFVNLSFIHTCDPYMRRRETHTHTHTKCATQCRVVYGNMIITQRRKRKET